MSLKRSQLMAWGKYLALIGLAVLAFGSLGGRTLAQPQNPNCGPDVQLFGVCNWHGFFSNFDETPFLTRDSFNVDNNLPWAGGGYESDMGNPGNCTNSTTRRPGLTHPDCIDSFIGILKGGSPGFIGIDDTMQWCNPRKTVQDPSNESQCDNNSFIIADAFIINTMLGKNQSDFRSDAVIGGRRNFFDCSARGHGGTIPPETCRGIIYARQHINDFKNLITLYDAAGLITWYQLYTINFPRESTDVIHYAIDEGPVPENSTVDSGHNHLQIFDPTTGNLIYDVNWFCGTVFKGEGLPQPPTSSFHAKPFGDNPVLNPDDEIATSATFTGHVQVTNGPANTNVTRQYYILHANGTRGPVVTGANSGPRVINTGTFTFPPDTRALNGQLAANIGDSVCEIVTTNPATPSGGAEQSALDANCTKIVAKPYTRSYGYDVFAGFNCGPGSGWTSSGGAIGSGQIQAFSKNFTQGSGAQLGVFAFGNIQGFSSAILHSPPPPFVPPQPDKGLSFANTVNPAGQLGASFSHCPTDYFNNTGRPPTSGIKASLDIGTLPSGSVYYTNRSSGITLHLHGTLTPGKKVAIYVDNNVVIDNDIKYAGPWAVDNIPSLFLIVTGEIRVTGNVNELDGTYVAQPVSSGGGSLIRTCVKSDATGSSYAGVDLFNNCNNKLLIRGQFIAEQIKLLRAFGSLKNSTGTNETPRTGTNAAEVFDPGPDTYLATPAFPPNSSTSTQTYDYFVSLPPVL